MSVGDAGKKLDGLLKRLRGRHADAQVPMAPQWEGMDAGVRELVFSMLLWDNRAEAALAAFNRLRQAFVDGNDLRVALPEDVGEVLGEACEPSLERAARLHCAMMDIYRREHRLRLDHLREVGKREARAYLDGVDGLPDYVRARLMLLCLGGHAIPVDARLCGRLWEEKALPEKGGVDAASGWLERQVHQGEALGVHALFIAWCEEPGRRSRAAEAPERRRSPRKGKAT